MRTRYRHNHSRYKYKAENFEEVRHRIQLSTARLSAGELRERYLALFHPKAKKQPTGEPNKGLPDAI